MLYQGVPSSQKTTPASLTPVRSEETTLASLASCQSLKLDLLDSTGIAVNENGHLTDIAGYPMQFDQSQQKRTKRTKFTAEDEQVLAIWLDRAAAQGISLKGPKFWQILERTVRFTVLHLDRANWVNLILALQNPRHTSLSWKDYWKGPFPDSPVDRNEDARNLERQRFLDQIDRNLQQSLSSIDVHGSSLDPNIVGLAGVGGDPPTPASVSTPEVSAESSDGTAHNSLDSPASSSIVQSSSEKANNSEDALIKVLGLNDGDALRAWLSQDWVVDAYEEYYHVAIHEWRVTMEGFQARGEPIPNPEKRSKQKSIVDHSAAALRSRNLRYTTMGARKHLWTAHDHDVRFVVRIVDEGRAPGRCWEGYRRDEHIYPLCHTAYRLMCWLRAMARIVNVSNSMGRWRRAKAVKWY